MKSTHFRREQDDQGKRTQESAATPASVGRVAGWDKQSGVDDNNSVC